ncbi:zinc ABC transporter substrate-binding protein [Robbsia sp. KACC 23696]|uniref:metal ABC transporter solute-binding protein, Zn/Mn family n=1 Tax=Robbsia sp. KACC 23696 TaxID=3149231 RepID=UPI00325BDC3D
MPVNRPRFAVAASLPSVSSQRRPTPLDASTRLMRRVSVAVGLGVAALVSAPAAFAAPTAAASTAATAPTAAPAAPLRVVAAENFYGNLVRALGGSHVRVDSILSNPNQDPHSFEASPSVARALSAADLVVYNGIDYDPWMLKLLSASPRGARQQIVAADVLGKHEGDNPHLWYDPATMPALAKAISAYLQAHDPAHAPEYRQRLQQTLDAQQAIVTQVAAMRARYAGIKVSATEPVFGYMAQAVGLDMQNQRFQLAVMNETEPAASDVARFEQGLKAKETKVLIYNAQTSDQMSRRLQQVAKQAGVPVVPVTETEPPGVSYPQWMLNQLNALDNALKHAP